MGKTSELLNFIDHSPTAFHAVNTATEILEQNGFLPLCESDAWLLEAGKGYFVTRNQSSIIAFRMPTSAPERFLIAASHTDSPMFKLKNDSIAPVFERYTTLNSEVYGGTIYSSWLDRPLTLAGRIVLSQNGMFTSRLVYIDRDLLVIPNLSIHFNRNVNAGYSYNPATDLRPLFCEGKNTTIKALIAHELGCSEEEIVGMELFVCNRAKGTTVGVSEEFFMAPRIDNLMCAFGTLEGFIHAENSTSVNVWFAADNEETGSATKQGAGSMFLSDVIDRICEAAEVDRRRVLASSMMVSADNAHAKHPNHPELSDAQNAPHMNGGVVIKMHASQKYTTDALSAAIFEHICTRADVPVQHFANRSDMASGGTLGSISNTHVPLLSVDIGMAQLAMHSACETAGSRDADYLCAAMKAFFESELTQTGDGSIRLQASENR